LTVFPAAIEIANFLKSYFFAPANIGTISLTTGIHEQKIV
jgi:hypothetical protein